MDAALAAGKLTQVKDNRVTLEDDNSITTYETELDEFKDQNWVMDNLGKWLQCKVIDGQIVEVDF